MFIIISPGVVELTVSTLLEFGYSNATRQVAQLLVVAIFFCTMVTLKTEEVPINRGFLNPCRVISMNPLGLTI